MQEHENPESVTADAPVTQLVEVMDRRRSMRRRSSTSVASQQLTHETSAVVAVVRDVVSPPALVAGDKAARPHFLKERSATMRGRVSIPALASQSPVSSSKASAFLVGLVAKSHPNTSRFEPKISRQHSGHSGPASLQRGGLPQRRSATTMDPGGDPHTTLPVRHRSILQQQHSTTPVQLHSIRSGLSALEPQHEDEHDSVSDVELVAKPLNELVRDLTLYAKKHVPLLRILHEIHRRLQDAEMDVGNGPTHVPLCRAIVDDGVLASVVQAMREFRFHVELQTTAIALLSFLADVSDLYAFLMAELDVEPLVHKVVADHVSHERLVMNGTTLCHAINDAKRKSHVIKMHKAREMEREKKRAASFGEAFAAGLHSMTKPKASTHTKSAPLDERRLHELHRPGSGSRMWQRSALSASLGAPPMLTSHYDLEVASTGRRPMAIPPLGRAPSTQDLDCELVESLHKIRPVTSPEPQSQTRCSRFHSGPPSVAAIYSKSLVFVAPSPLGERMNVKRAHSAAAMMIKHWPTKGRTSTPGTRVGSSSRPPTDDVSYDGIGAGEQPSGDQIADMASTGSHAKEDTEEDEEQQQPEANGQETTDDDDVDPEYDDDDFAADDGDRDGEWDGTNAQQADPVVDDHGRLLPIGSDSELIKLVESPSFQQEQLFTGGETVESAGPLASVISDSELVGMIDTDGGGGGRGRGRGTEEVSLLDPTIDKDPVTAELVGLLSSCVDSDNPTATPLSGPDSLATTLKPVKKKTKKATTLSCSLSAAAWAPPTTIVRPVNRRIMNKTAQTTKRAVASMTAARGQSTSTTQITTILDKITTPTPHNGDSGDALVPSARETSPPPIAFRRHTPEPPSTPTTSISQIQSLYARGLQHHKHDELDAAIHCYKQGIQLQQCSGVQREFASLYINLGSAKLTQHKLSDALEAFTHAERIQPHNTKAIFNSALALMQLEQWEDAIAKLERVVATDTSHVRAKSALEQCYRAMQASQRHSAT